MSTFMHISAYGRIVEGIAQDTAQTPKEVLQKIQKPWESDLDLEFREDCERAQIPVPAAEDMPDLLKTLWDYYTG